MSEQNSAQDAQSQSAQNPSAAVTQLNAPGVSPNNNANSGVANSSDPPLTSAVYTPGSDIAEGYQQNQVIWGREGNNTVIGYQPLQASLGNSDIDYYLGGFATNPDGHTFSNTFVLGDWRQSNYDNGDPSISGTNDYAIITDFNPALDHIQLHGSPSNYELQNVPGVGEAIFDASKTSGPDLIAVVLGQSNLNLSSSYFQYAGNSPPTGPTQPLIKQIGSSGFDLGFAVATDPSGNVNIAGGTTGSLASPNSEDARQSFIAKYDSNGNQSYLKQGDYAGFNTIYGLGSIGVDASGNTYTAGLTQTPITGPILPGGDAVIAKFDSSGNPLWTQQLGGEGSILYSGNSISVDSTGNSYASGVDAFSTSSGSVATQDRSWVTKYDPDGNQLWFTEIGPNNPGTFTEAYGDTLGKLNDVYATGWTLGDVGGQNAGLYDAWISKLDNNTGQLLWSRQFGTPDFDWSWSAATDSQDNVYSTGWTLGTFPGQQHTGEYDAFLTKYDTNGNQQWIKQFGGSNLSSGSETGDTEAFHTYVDSQNNIYVTGYTNAALTPTATAGATPTDFNAFVAKYDTNGNQQWIQEFGNSQQATEAYGISGDNSGNLFVTGITFGSLGAVNAGSTDAFAAKLSSTTGGLENFSGTTSPLSTSSSTTTA
ncbi:MAG: SBBP repeat-containing protein [Chroococcidiopsidaceae cyanobacterium CP_BM_ER_R8_30]|nr:SBBP repeat-containing protein [Chroococcidiopsidaceae cyanobacterium CP_BM_ER_R8_30]